MKKIVHFSDLHVGYENLGDRFRVIASNLTLEKGDRPNDYVIVITGDLVDDANDLTRYLEVKTVLDTLRQSGFVNILLCPGNHDYGTGSLGDKKFVSLFSQVFFGKEITFPKKDIIDEIAFIGLDSMAEELHWYDRIFSEGEIGKVQLDKLKKMLRKDDVRSCKKRVIYLHHHPFDAFPFHQLIDSSAFLEVIESTIRDGISIDALLYGHNHAGKTHNGAKDCKVPRCYDAGTATLKPRPSLISKIPWFKEHASTRVISIESDNIQLDYPIDLL